MRETETPAWEVPAINNLDLVTVYGDGSTALVSLTHTCVLAEFVREQAQQGLPHVRLTDSMEQAAARDAGLEYDGAWPGWGPVCRYLRHHPEVGDTSHWSSEVAAAVKRASKTRSTGQVGNQALEAPATDDAHVPLAADDAIYADVQGSEEAPLASDAFAALAVVNTIRDVLWRVGDTHTPDKEWDPETLEYIADILTDAGLGPVLTADAPSVSLDEQRHAVAEDAFAMYDLGDAVVSDTGGWEYRSGADEWSLVFFVANPPGPSVRELFVVRFQPGSARVAQAYWSC